MTFMKGKSKLRVNWLSRGCMGNRLSSLKVMIRGSRVNTIKTLRFQTRKKFSMKKTMSRNTKMMLSMKRRNI